MATHNTDKRSTYTSNEDRSLKANQKLSSPPDGEDIVISGMAGQFPDSSDVYHFRDNLFNKVDLVSGDYRRWRPIHPEVPQRSGKLLEISKFDTGFFGVCQRHVNNMDPMCRSLLERTFEALLDAGYNPSEMAGTKTGVFVGSCFAESEKVVFYNKQVVNGHSMLGSTRSMLAQQISYFFKFQGPSYITDTACSSSLIALENAYRHMREGRCESAIVAGAGLCLHPIVSLQFARLGVLSADGNCKVFDNAADGYARSEGIAAIFIQKSKDARRIYAHIIHSKTNCDGFKQQGITYPSSEMQKILMKEIYHECDIDPSQMTYVEAHGTGTKVGDPEELNSLDNVFCTKRDKPLYIGAIKSNIGHNEPVSGICSIVKVLIGMESGFIPPNRNFSKPREGIPAFEKGRLKVVVDKMPWPDNNALVGVNSFGFGGANGHVVIRWNRKEKVKGGLPEDDLPRLVCVSGRHERAINVILDELRSRKIDAEYVKLLHTIFRKEIVSHPYRGYSIISKSGEIHRSVRCLGIDKQKMTWVFTNFDQVWPKLGRYLLVLPIFTRTLEKINKVLLQEININIIQLLENFNEKDMMSQILGTMAVQICLADVLNALGIFPDSVVGLGTGELIAAYSDEFLSLDVTVFAFLYVGFAYCKGKDNKIHSDSFLRKELLSNLRHIVPKKHEFQKWFPLYQKNRTNELNKQGSVEYFVENIICPITFEEGRESLAKESTVLVIGPKIKTAESKTILSLIEDDLGETVVNLLSTLGSLYEIGADMQLDKLYPEVSWPVSRGTPMVSPLIKWEYNNDWFVALYKNEDEIKSGQRVVHITINEDDWNFVTGHVVDGRNLFPATGYLILVWETLAMMLGKLLSDMKVVFENVRFIRATNLPKQGSIALTIVVQAGNKNFEITEGGTTVVTGKIYELEATDQRITELSIPASEQGKNIPFLNQKDIYKELRLRGYNYRGVFQGLKECDVNATKGSLVWNGNWIAFMDNMLQMKILQVDTKNLYVPTSIQQVIIDGHKHISDCSKLGEKENIVPIYLYAEPDIIRSGGVEMRGVNASAIPRKKYGIPVLEVYKFIPNKISLPMAQSVRIMVQIILENNMTIKVKSVEQPDPTRSELKLLSPLIQQALGDIPLIQAEIIVLSENPLDLPGITVEDKKLNLETNSLLVVVSKVFQKNELLDAVLNIVKDTNGYIITREDANFNISTIAHNGIDIVCVHRTEEETLILLNKSTESKQVTAIDISDSMVNLHWIPTVQNAVKSGQNLILYSQNRYINGILGLVNCLRREPNGRKISCFLIIDEAPKFDITHPFYREQAQKHLGINVWKDNKWGSYRHLVLEESRSIQSEHCYVNVTVRGDLSSLRWIEGPLTKDVVVEPEKELVSVYCSALNFRDIMTASGRISNDLITSNRIEQECVQGFEFSGRSASGKRVMGMVQAGALSSLVVADSHMLWSVPFEWSLEDAATVPVVYATVIYALMIRTNLKHRQSILIHSATGGVGQAAINIALYFGCNIFVTVGTQEKRDFLRKNYPQIEESHIGNSRDLSFEQMVQTETKERGVDIVLNSLAEEKLTASVRCLALGGQFLEIGKFDMVSDNHLSMHMFAKNINFHGVMLDTLFGGSPVLKEKMSYYMLDLIKKGAVKPLPRTVFKRDELLQAYRYMVTGKHMGKVLINVRKEEKEKICEVPRETFEGIPRYFCYPASTYIIVGGLGGFGLQLADWLVIRGARKIILTSRTGIKTGYQSMMISLWRQYGSEIVVRTDDVTSKEGCLELIEYANSLGPVKAIFNLAVVLKDGLFENQTAENYQTSLAPKAIATQHLDAITREQCPQLSHFVIFSSVSCGRGNAGQTNYGMANSIMERICESRKADGYPALAIQWGAIGDVGLVADMLQESNAELVIGGTLQQRISSCLQILDTFLRQNEAIVGSMVVAEKRNSSSSNNIIDAVVNIIGIGDLKNISLHSTFPELGMDSMMAVEVKQTLEREYEVFLSAQDIRTMTFSRLKEIATEKIVDESLTAAPLLEKDGLSEDVKLLLHHVGDEASAKVPVVRMNSLVNKGDNAIKVFVLPGIEGTSISMEPLVKNLSVHAACLQYCVDSDIHTLEQWANAVLPYVEAKPSNFVLVAHSFGCAVAIEVTRLLEATGRYGKLIFIDGSPGLMIEMIKKQFEIENEELFQTGVICAYMTRYLPFSTIMKHKVNILTCRTLEDRIKYGLSIGPNINQSPEYVTALCIQGYRKMKACINYIPNFDKLKSEIKLIKPIRPTVLGYPEDYGLSELFEKPVDVKAFEGNHLTILENPDVAEEVNRFINSDEPMATNFVNGISAKIFGEIRQVQSHE